MSPTLEDQERHLLVKVIDRVLYKLDDLVRPYVHKVRRLGTSCGGYVVEKTVIREAVSLYGETSGKGHSERG